MADNKKQAPKAEKNANDAIPVEGNGNEIVNEKTRVVTDTQLKRELYEKDKELEEIKAELEAVKQRAKEKPVKAVDNSDEIASLRAQLNALSNQVITGARGEKTLFRPAVQTDLQEEYITFTARSVFFVVGSYLGKNGLEKVPPHKLIIFTYQASDIRKEGNESVIKSFSQYSTNLKTEIEFLRQHPHYGITFSENTNEMMDEDTRDTQFKVMAANQLSSVPPEVIFERAREYKIANYMSLNAEELRFQIVHKMAEEYKKENKKMADDIIRRRVLASSLQTEGKPQE
jgi:hypothetical protein